MNIIYVIIITVENVARLKRYRRLTMKLKIAKFKDIDHLFIEYKGYTISCRLKKELVFNNNIGIRIETEEEKREFESILRYFIRELERLEF